MSIRVFTIRLDTDEQRALDILKVIGREKTDSKIIRYIIRRFEPLMNELRIEKEKNKKLQARIDELNSKIKNFKFALNDLLEIDINNN